MLARFPDRGFNPAALTRRETGLRVLNVITGLNVGGAEMMLRRLVRATKERGALNSVVSLTDRGPVAHLLQQDGVTTHALGMARELGAPRALLRLRDIIKAESPDVVQTWMYHANLAGGIASRLAGVRGVVWNVRAGVMLASGERTRTRLLARMSGPVATYMCKSIVTNSHTARLVHERMGYPPRLFRVIANGFDLAEFRFDAPGRADVRHTFGIAESDFVVGTVGRYHPAKGYSTLLDAAALLIRQFPRLTLLLAGDGVDDANAALRSQLASRGLGARTRLLGRRSDLPSVYSAMDLFVLASEYEAFPNVLAEAMACERPCAATAVGDVAQILGDPRRVVEPGNASALAAVCAEVGAMPLPRRLSLGRQARTRVEQNYSLGAVADQYMDLYREVARA